MRRWPTFSTTYDEHGQTLCLELASRSFDLQHLRVAGRTLQWASLWAWLLVSALLLDLCKLSIWLLIVNWQDEIPFRESPITDLYLLGAGVTVFAAPLLLPITLRRLFRAWRDLFPRPPVKPWVLPDPSWFSTPAQDDPDDMTRPRRGDVACPSGRAIRRRYAPTRESNWRRSRHCALPAAAPLPGSPYPLVPRG